MFRIHWNLDGQSAQSSLWTINICLRTNWYSLSMLAYVVSYPINKCLRIYWNHHIRDKRHNEAYYQYTLVHISKRCRVSASWDEQDYQYTLAHISKRQKCANLDSIFMHKHIMLTRTTSCEIYSLLDLTKNLTESDTYAMQYNELLLLSRFRAL